MTRSIRNALRHAATELDAQSAAMGPVQSTGEPSLRDGAGRIVAARSRPWAGTSRVRPAIRPIRSAVDRRVWMGRTATPMVGSAAAPTVATGRERGGEATAPGVAANHRPGAAAQPDAWIRRVRPDAAYAHAAGRE